MRISQSLTVPGSEVQVAAALLSEELAAARAKKLGIDSYTHQIVGTTAHTQVAIPTSALPAKAQRFVKSDIKVTINAEAQGNEVRYTTDIHGAPVKLSWVVRLSPAAPGTVPTVGKISSADGAVAAPVTTCDIDANLSVSIPLFGSKLEGMAAEHVQDVLHGDFGLVASIIAAR